MSHLLIYDADLSGHHRDYLDALVNYLGAHIPLTSGISNVTLMLPGLYWSVHGDIPLPSPVHRSDIPDDFLEQRNAAAPRQRALLEIELLAKCVTEQRVDELVLMNLDYFQVALASSSARALRCRISGIQLQPYTRSELVALQVPRKPALLFRALRKRMRLQKMLNNIRMARLLVPADDSAVALLNKRHRNRVQAVVLPEPYLMDPARRRAISTADLPDIHTRYSLKRDARIVLVFGKLAARKNIENVMKAMSLLHQSGQLNTVLLVVGKASTDYQSALRRQAEQDKTLTSSVYFDFDFVEDAVLRALFEACDVVAMPYSRAYQSSGILFQAIQYGKPVVTANEGLANELVQQYRLGRAVDPQNPEQISLALSDLIQSWSPSQEVQSLFDCHTADNHAAVLLGQH